MRGALAKAGSQWYVLKLSSMSTIMREWAAIHCLAHMPLRDVLLTAKASSDGCVGRQGAAPDAPASGQHVLASVCVVRQLPVWLP